MRVACKPLSPARWRRHHSGVAGIVVVGTEPYARYLDHGKWTEMVVVRGVFPALPGGGETLGGALFVGGWVLMLAAMMLRNATIGDG
jgi:hypothetical protein